MKATDFNLEKEINFDFDKGITSFRNSRLVIFDVNSIGLLRQTIIEEMGLKRARTLFLKFGFQSGYSDFMQMKASYEFDSEVDLLSSGPIMHTWEGIVHATPTELHYDRQTGDFYFAGIWKNSYEAQQHLMNNDFSAEPVCWTLMGYASGWATGFFGENLLAIETKCMGMGDEHCEWLIKPLNAWDLRAIPYIDALKEQWR